jgi:SAM-dependent methyltransferase
MSISQGGAIDHLHRIAPESHVGGFSFRDSTFLFYALINAVITPRSRILDFGAGRGVQGTNGNRFVRDLINLKGRVSHITGVDVDKAVLENPMVNDAYVVAPGSPLPFEPASFDIIYSDWVLEHVDDPRAFIREVERVLKPGGWFFGRTPNKFGLIAASASLVPNRLHARTLRLLQPDREEQDVFPTRYRINTLHAIRKHLSPDRWSDHSILVDTEVMYLARIPILFALSELISRILPKRFRPVLFVIAQKRS